MTSTFNLLTAGGARFDKNRFKNDIELFTPKPARPAKSAKAAAASRKGKEKANDDSDAAGASDDESDNDEDDQETRPAPPKQKITLSGSDPLPRSLHANLPSLTTHPSHPSTSHAGQPLLDALRSSNIHSLWGVQCAVGGCLLDDRDVMCIAPTGSGKTLSYLLPTLVRLGDPAREIRATETQGEGEENWKGIRGLVLVPTHDLAVQIHGVFKAVSAGRKWRALVLSKATEHAVCESAPGKKFTGARASKNSEGDSDEDGSEDDDIDEEMDSDAESTGSTDEFADDQEFGPDAGEAPKTDALGIDLLIATPERLHHLLEQQLVSLAR
jgi:ATP-dependent RNA helicase DDX52/ROK1